MQDIVCGMVEGAHYCNFEVMYLRHVTNKKNVWNKDIISVWRTKWRQGCGVFFSHRVSLRSNVTFKRWQLDLLFCMASDIWAKN